MTEYGLVLSSDGSKSSFEIGAWKALRELEVTITAVAGSFVGALNAALIAQGDFEKAVRFWRNISSNNLFFVNKHIAQKYADEWSKTETRQFRKLFINYIQGRTDELAPLKEMIDTYIDEKAVRASGTFLGFVSISLTNLEADMLTLNNIPKGKLTQYLLAAACFPQIAQVNRAKDSQFSLEYSPYMLIQTAGVAEILSTDEILAVPPSLVPEVTVINSSEAMELTLNESVEHMRSCIKLGYIDTLKMFEKSVGQNYLIKQGTDSEFNSFRLKIGRPLPAHLNDLIRILLRLKNLTKDIILTRLSNLLRDGGIEVTDLHVSLLENLAKFVGVKGDEKYFLDNLLTATVSESKVRLDEAKKTLAEPDDLKDTLMNISAPGRNIPDSDLFMKYFLLLISAKPDKYNKFRAFISYLHPKTTVALVTLIYTYYA